MCALYSKMCHVICITYIDGISNEGSSEGSDINSQNVSNASLMLLFCLSWFLTLISFYKWWQTNNVNFTWIDYWSLYPFFFWGFRFFFFEITFKLP